MAAIEDANQSSSRPQKCGPGLNPTRLRQNRRRRLANTRHLRVMGPLRTEALSGGIQKWSVERYKRLSIPSPPRPLASIESSPTKGTADLADNPRLPADRRLQEASVDPKPSLFSGQLPGKTRLVDLYASAAESCVGRLPTSKRERQDAVCLDRRTEARTCREGRGINCYDCGDMLTAVMLVENAPMGGIRRTTVIPGVSRKFLGPRLERALRYLLPRNRATRFPEEELH